MHFFQDVINEASSLEVIVFFVHGDVNVVFIGARDSVTDL